jgi:hypothetical protein
MMTIYPLGKYHIVIFSASYDLVTEWRNELRNVSRVCMLGHKPGWKNVKCYIISSIYDVSTRRSGP